MKADFCFPKSNRLLSKSDFNSLREGSRFFVSGVLVSYCKPNATNNSRIGIAVSKKYGNAVQRNKFKRHIREVFRTKIKTIGFDILLVPNLRKIKANRIDQVEVIKKLENSFIDLEAKLSEF